MQVAHHFYPILSKKSLPATLFGSTAVHFTPTSSLGSRRMPMNPGTVSASLHPSANRAQQAGSKQDLFARPRRPLAPHPLAPLDGGDQLRERVDRAIECQEPLQHTG